MSLSGFGEIVLVAPILKSFFKKDFNAWGTNDHMSIGADASDNLIPYLNSNRPF